MSNVRPTDRQTGFLMPPSVDEWLPERHLARFVVDVVDGLDRKAMSKSDRGSGSASYRPAVLLGLLIYGCATGVFSSRKLERATDDSVAFRFIAANDHPDHDTIATVRGRFLKERALPQGDRDTVRRVAERLLVSERIEHDLGIWRTQHSGKSLALATTSSLLIDGHDLPPTVCGELRSSWTWTACVLLTHRRHRKERHRNS